MSADVNSAVASSALTAQGPERCAELGLAAASSSSGSTDRMLAADKVLCTLVPRALSSAPTAALTTSGLTVSSRRSATTRPLVKMARTVPSGPGLGTAPAGAPAGAGTRGTTAAATPRAASARDQAPTRAEPVLGAPLSSTAPATLAAERAAPRASAAALAALRATLPEGLEAALTTLAMRLKARPLITEDRLEASPSPADSKAETVAWAGLGPPAASACLAALTTAVKAGSLSLTLTVPAASSSPMAQAAAVSTAATVPGLLAGEGPLWTTPTRAAAPVDGTAAAWRAASADSTPMREFRSSRSVTVTVLATSAVPGAWK
mmetsp:Transcript_2327/g.9076  ORF Transcript_2327/g.9076 Transcript_2327/m.9076 type:complete len:321 (+) Transcript_2327:2290-3252(+)